MYISTFIIDIDHKQQICTHFVIRLLNVVKSWILHQVFNNCSFQDIGQDELYNKFIKKLLQQFGVRCYRGQVKALIKTKCKDMLYTDNELNIIKKLQAGHIFYDIAQEILQMSLSVFNV